MIVGIHQPQYLPWIGFFDKIDRSDRFVLLDDVQYKKNEWQNRNKIRNANGWQWLTVPVHHEFGQAIREVRIDNEIPWRRKHLNAIELAYSKAPFFNLYRTFFEDCYGRSWERLADINVHCIRKFTALLGIKTELVLASQLDAHGEKTAHLVNICKRLNAEVYLSGKDGPLYMDMAAFEEAGISVSVQDFKHPVYTQHGARNDGEFEPLMSVIDLLFNCGERSLAVIRSMRT